MNIFQFCLSSFSSDIRTENLPLFPRTILIADDATRKIIFDKKRVFFKKDDNVEKKILWYIQNSILMFKCVKKYKNSRNFYFTANKLSVECSKKIHSEWMRKKYNNIKKYIKWEAKIFLQYIHILDVLLSPCRLKIVWDYGSLFVVNLQ